MLYYLQTRGEKEEYLRMIKKGELDIIVGTHSLLGNRVVYNNLGLLVVDEEQVCLFSSFHFVNEYVFLLSFLGLLSWFFPFFFLHNARYIT